jgi:hypothetical protein
MEVSGLIFNSNHLYASIQHDIFLNQEDTINNIITFNRFPIFAEIKSVKIDSIILQETKKTITYV